MAVENISGQNSFLEWRNLNYFIPKRKFDLQTFKTIRKEINIINNGMFAWLMIMIIYKVYMNLNLNPRESLRTDNPRSTMSCMVVVETLGFKLQLSL